MPMQSDRPAPPLSPAHRFAWAALVLTLLSGGLTLATFGPAGAMAAMALCGGGLSVATLRLGSYPHGRLGAANVVTQARLALIAPLVGPILLPGAVTPQLAWSLTALAAIALALDGVDGWLARRASLTSAFGARFDMEVDALFGALLALAALRTDKAGLWVLALGGMRYGFVAAARIWPWLGRPLPPSQRRRVVCVVQIAALVTVLAPPVVPPLSGAIAAVATLALGWSFAADALWLRWRR